MLINPFNVFPPEMSLIITRRVMKFSLMDFNGVILSQYFYLYGLLFFRMGPYNIQCLDYLSFSLNTKQSSWLGQTCFPLHSRPKFLHSASQSGYFFHSSELSCLLRKYNLEWCEDAISPCQHTCLSSWALENHLISVLLLLLYCIGIHFV